MFKELSTGYYYFSLFVFCLILAQLFFESCSDPASSDDKPPSVTITFPQNNSVVSEVVKITCVATDNEGVKKVELWVDGASTGVTDNTEPYILEWNTTTYNDGTNHTITVRAYDINDNKTDSDPIFLTVDNSNSSPNQISIISVSYTLTEMTVIWEQSTDQDFDNYELFYSDTEGGNKISLVTKTDIIDTLFILTQFDPSHENWFWINVTDIYGYSTLSNGYMIKDEPPNVSEIIHINYQNNSFSVSWSMNNEDDFSSYSLYESFNPDMSNESLIYQTNNRADTNFVVTGVDTNEFRYYRLVVTDYWNQETLSSIKRGSSYLVSTSIVLISGGTFTMGDTWGDGEPDELPTHSVTLDSFYIGKYEVTQEQFETLMGFNPSQVIGDDLPVETLSWYQAIDFCNTLSTQEGLTPCYTINGTNVTCDFTANGYRLPTEAEWEFAARGGNLSQNFKYSGSNNIDEVAWYTSNSGGITHMVGLKLSNELGIYDLSGNVWEWCWDWYGNYPSSPQINPTGPTSGSHKIIRGGSCIYPANRHRVSERAINLPDANYGEFIGFRVARSY